MDNIESSFSEATGEFSGFFKLVKEGETDERLDTAAGLLKELIDVTRNGFGETISAVKSFKADTSAMLEKQNKMLEKQDLLLKVTERGFSEAKEEMQKGFGEVKNEVHLPRDDFREMFMHEVSELRSEIAEIKATLARMQEAG